MADYKYQNLNPKYDDTRYKINNSVLRMMNANPALGTGYIIGSMLGENYWGKKRAKREAEVEQKWQEFLKNRGIVSPNQQSGAAQELGNKLGTMGSLAEEGLREAGQTAKTNWAEEANKALEAYKNSNGNGNTLYQGSAPRTPQQANKSTEVPTAAKQWQDMANGSAYNPGGTVLYTGGVRNLNNVVPQSAPSVANFPQKPANGPAPYTDDQLRQIAAQNYSPEELARHATPQEIQRMNALVNPTPAASSGGLLGPVAETVAPASNAYIPQVDMREEQGYGTPDPAPNLPVQNTTSTPIPEAAPNIPVVNASPSTTSTAPESGLTDGVYNNMNWLARKRAEEQNNPSNWTLNLARLLTPSNSPYYSQKEIEEAYSQPLIARK